MRGSALTPRDGGSPSRDCLPGKEDCVLPSACKRLHAGLQAVRAWSLWELPRWLPAFVLSVTVVYLAAVGLAVSTVHLSGRDLLVFGALLGCIAATVELTKRAGENAGVTKDVYAVWELPIAILLPPAYALLAPL